MGYGIYDMISEYLEETETDEELKKEAKCLKNSIDNFVVSIIESRNEEK